MCSETFLRLPEEKRKRILDAAWEEFTRVSFADASINQIVRRAGIARGSFYQYFRDKEELVSYLMDDAWDYLMRGYHDMLRQVDGDIFQLQMACFDRFLGQMDDADPVLERFLCFLRINPGLDAQKLLGRKAECSVPERIWPDMELTRFRCQEREFVVQVLTLSLMSLAAAVVESVLHPEQSEEYRNVLALRLEIIRCGSVKP